VATDVPDERRPARALHLEISRRSILVVFGVLAAGWLVWRLWTVVLLFVIALVIVGTLNPVIERLESRGLRRRFALPIVFLAIVAAFVLIVFLAVPPLLAQVSTLTAHAPERQRQLVAWLDAHQMGGLADSVRNTASEEWVARASSYVFAYSRDLAELLGYGVTTIFLAFYMLADGTRSLGALYAFVPRRHHMRLSRILFELQTIVGGYMRGQLITSVAIFVFMFALLTVLGVPNALALSVFAAVTDVIPFVGGLIATSPAALMALSRGADTALIVCAVCFVYQEFESRILVPRVYGRTLRLPPAGVLMALLIGGTLQGILGALLALPIAAGLLMVVRELRVDLPGNDVSVDADVQDREDRAEEVYERLSAGTAPSEAAEIATALAKEIRDDVDVLEE
jgi:predicted PurR-regulated permease PerM